MAAFLGQVCRREIDRQMLVGKPQTDRMQRVAHALPAFGHGLVRQPHNGEGLRSRRDADLNLDRTRLDADKRNRCNLGIH